MKRLNLFKTLTLGILFICLSVCAVMFVATTKTAKADSPVSFEMDAGAYAKLVDDGGMRMRVMMDETTKNSVLEEDNELFFLLMTEEKFADAKTGNGFNFDQYLTNCDNFNEDGCVKIVANKSLIYAKDGVYYSNLLIYNFPTAWLNQTLCAVAGKTVAGETEFASFEIDNQVCKKMYEVVNHFGLSEYAPEIFEVYGDWYATEDYPVVISTQAQYDGLADFINNVIDLTGKNVEIGAGIERDLAYESEVFAGVNLIKNELVVTFMANGVVYETVRVAKNTLVTAPTTNPDASNETATYEFIGWDYDFANAITEDIVINANFNLISKDITSLFKFTGTEGIVADTTWSDFGNVKYGVSNWSRSDYVDISEYQGKTLRVTMPNSASYGLVFYTEKSQSADSTAAGWSYKIATGNSGDVHVVEIIIPETAVYVRTTYYYEKGTYADSVTATPFSAQIIG